MRTIDVEMTEGANAYRPLQVLWDLRKQTRGSQLATLQICRFGVQSLSSIRLRHFYTFFTGATCSMDIPVMEKEQKYCLNRPFNFSLGGLFFHYSDHVIFTGELFTARRNDGSLYLNPSEVNDTAFPHTSSHDVRKTVQGE